MPESHAMAAAYEDAVAWLYTRQRLGIKLGLENMTRLVAALGDPAAGVNVVHVAGTNGKGSVTAMLAATLRAAGHRVGATTSPHLIRFTERIQIDGDDIAPEAVVRGVEAVRVAVDGLAADGHEPTFFECVTALALWAFRDAGCTWAIVETGLGGRLDASNVVAPAASVITNVTLDHADLLGDNIPDIAFEKAGIIKPGVPVVTDADGPALTVIKLQANAVGAPFMALREAYQVVPGIGGMGIVTPTGEAHYAVAAAGDHQLRNAATVVATVQVLRDAGHDVPQGALAAALAATTVPGRLEAFTRTGADGRLVEVILDGAHNEASAIALRNHLAHRDLYGFHLIVGFNADKHWQTALDQWWPVAARVHAVPIRSDRGLPAATIAEHLAGEWVPVSVQADVGAAITAALDAGAGTILVAGSLFLVGEARAHLTGQPLEEIRGNQ